MQPVIAKNISNIQQAIKNQYFLEVKEVEEITNSKDKP